ncbi:hypothetical protein Tsp_09013, partial [Trichinella spiralis]
MEKSTSNKLPTAVAIHLKLGTMIAE